MTKELTFPKELQQALLAYLKARYSKKSGGAFSDADFRYFAKGAGKLSTLFTESRDRLKVNYLSDPVLRTGYLIYFFPVNFLKTFHVLGQIKEHLPRQGATRVLDLGCGPGTSALAALEYYRSLGSHLKKFKLELHLIDSIYPALKDAKALYQSFNQSSLAFPSSLSTLHFDLKTKDLKRAFGKRKFHLIFLSNVLNEMNSFDLKASLVERLIEDHLEKNGLLIILEPALRHPTRALQILRDHLVVDQKVASVVAPCLHQNNCPLNSFNKRDWCHFYFDWEYPSFIKKLDRLIGNKKELLYTSYLVLRKNAPVKQVSNQWRVISNVMRTKGKKEVVLCGEAGRYKVTRLDKDKKKTNAALDRVKRGDVVEVKFEKDKKIVVDGQYRLKEGGFHYARTT